jgi:peptidylprolyl isomerase
MTRLAHRRKTPALAALALALTAAVAPAAEPQPPPPPPGTMAAVLAASRPEEWRRLDPARTVYMDLDAGRVIIELAPTFAPALYGNLRTLLRTGYFDGLSINRVQDNFVVQWGDADGKRAVPIARTSPPEFERAWSPDLAFTALPAGDRAAGRIWMAHCYGALGVGRDNAADSGTGIELYAVIGHAPRQLDRNITVAGRVVQGMELLAALPRGSQAMGFYATAPERVAIRRVRFADALPAAERTELEALRTDSASFAAVVESRRNRRDEWYLVPAGKIDLCSVPLPVRRVAATAAR